MPAAQVLRLPPTSATAAAGSATKNAPLAGAGSTAPRSSEHRSSRAPTTAGPTKRRAICADVVPSNKEGEDVEREHVARRYFYHPVSAREALLREVIPPAAQRLCRVIHCPCLVVAGSRSR